MIRRRVLVGLGLAAAMLAAHPSRAAVLDFASASGATTPLTVTSAGISATFSSPSDPGAFLVNSSVFATLGSTILQSPGLGAVELDVLFASPVSTVQFAFATDDLFVDPTAITATFLNGATVVGSQTVTGVVQAASGFPEGIISYDGVPITGFTLSDANAPGIAIGDIYVPEPAVLSLLALPFAAIGFSRRRGALA